MNQSGDDQAECPLCMEPFEVDDLNFFPCTCGYQICRFCWHRIRTDENGLCPACRKAYPENPADFKPLSQEQVAKLKAEKRQKEQQKKQKATESRKHLANVRVVQKNLVFVVGLPIRLADPSVLKKHEYFGKFGKIQKVVINQSTAYAGSLGPSASAYVTYNRYEDALRAIQAINNIWVDNRQIKTSLGTTKYCSHFIKAQTCPKPDCMYLHDLGDPEASFTKEEMQRGKHQEYERNLFEQFNNSISQERKTTPSPPALGNSLPNSECTATYPSVNKEAWPSLQNGTTQTNTGGGTGSTLVASTPEIVSSTTTITTASTTNTGQSLSGQPTKQQQQQQSSKTKQKDKNNSGNEKSTNKRKGKEKQMNGLNNGSHTSSNSTSGSSTTTTTSSSSSNNNNNNNNSSNNNNNNSTSIKDNNNGNSNNNNNNNNNINIADKHETSAKNNKEKEKRVTGDATQVENSVNNSRILSSNNRSSLYGNDSTYFSNNSFIKKSTGSKDSISLPNGFIKVPDNVTVNYETGFGESNKERQDADGRLLANGENERVTAGENETEKPLVNGYLTENVNGSFDKSNYNPKHSYSYQNGTLNTSSTSQQNIFNNYISLNKFGGQLKNENLLGENNEAFMNQNNHILGQQNFLFKQQLAQQQRTQPSLQQMLMQQQQQQQQQQSLYQQPQSQYSQDFRLVQQQQQQQQQQQPMNGLHSQSQHFNYMQQPNLRDQLLLQQKQNQLILNNYSSSGNNFIHLPNSDDLVVVDNLIPQHKYIEKGLNHANLYASDYSKLKDNRKSEEGAGEKGNAEVHSRVGDDELGFDPFHETQKALADLMEKELLIQQNKQVLQHKNDQYYHQSPQSYQNHVGFDNCGRGFNQIQVNMLNQQNHVMGGKLLAQIHSQQILNCNNQKSSGSNRLDGVRCTLPPPGFGSPAQNGPPGHMSNFGQGIPRNSNSRKILPFMSLSNGESSFQPHYVPNGVTKSDDWPESLRSLVQDGSASSPSSGSPSFSSGPKGWSNIGNCSDWTALDPAIVSSSRPQHLSLHAQSLLNNQGLSQLHQNHLQNQMCQLNIGSVLGHNNWSTHRQSEDNWSTHIQTNVPPPGFTLRHTGADMKKPVMSGIEGLE